MNTIHETIYLVALKGKELLVVRDSQNDPWELPHSPFIADIDEAGAIGILGKHLAEVSVEKIEIVPEEELRDSGNVFSGSKLCICTVAEKTRSRSFSTAWFMKGDYPYHILSEEAQAAISLPSIQKRLGIKRSA